MSLNVIIRFKEPRQSNYYLEHPYIYHGLSESDKAAYREEEYWSANITHNLGEMANHVPVSFNGTETTLYFVCWRPEEIGVRTAGDLLPLLVQGIHYMVDHRAELTKLNPPNGWGSYESFMKFLLNYKQACEDNAPDCEINAWR